ncbi:MAG: hypothetical protein JW850_07095 [Thermoflexales bacterium]|nr:hypothetical protein [Thermoflexales bacterium]
MLEAIISHYPVQVLTPALLIHGTMEPMGSILDFLNDAKRGSLAFVDATVYDLGGKFKPAKRRVVTIRKPEICALYVDDEAGRKSVQVFKRAEPLIIHLPQLVCRGNIHLGADTRLPDVFDVLVGQFFVLTDVAVYPMIPMPGPFPAKADLILSHKDTVQGYYQE